MKYFLAIALLVSVASAGMVKPTPASDEIAQIQEIIAAILNPSTDPATAVALEEMLLDVLGVKPEPVAIGPALIDYPEPEEELHVPPSPAVEVAAPAPKSPLVQIIVNINHASADVSPVDIGPAIVPRPVPESGPGIIPRPEPESHIEDIVPEPVHVVDVAPAPVEPVIIAEPILPSPAVVLPDILN